MEQLDIFTQNYIYQIANRSLYNDVMNELNNKYESIKEQLDTGYQSNDISYFNNFLFFKIPVRLIKNIQTYDDELIIRKYESLSGISHLNRYEYHINKLFDRKQLEFYHGYLNEWVYGNSISLCHFYSMFLQNGVKPKLINNIFQANGLNFGMREIIINV